MEILESQIFGEPNPALNEQDGTVFFVSLKTKFVFINKDNIDEFSDYLLGMLRIHET